MKKGRLLITTLCLSLTYLAAPVFASSIAWKAASSGSWSIGTNWVGNAAPGPSDVGVIALPGTYDVNINGNVSVGGVSLSGNGARLRVNNATLTTTAGISVGSASVLDLNGGTVSGGSLSLNGKMTSAGTANVNVAVTTATTTTIEVGIGNLFVANGFTSRGLISFPASDIRGFTVSNGTLTNANTGTISMASAGGLTATLDNQGTISVSAPQVQIGSSHAGVTHSNSGAINVTANAYLEFATSSATLNSNGNISVGTGGQFLIEQGTFNQTGGSITGSGELALYQTTAVTFVSNPTIANIYLGGNGIVFPSPLVNGASQHFRIGPTAEVSAPSLTNQYGYTLEFYEGSDVLHIPMVTNLGTFIAPRYLLLDGNLNLGPASDLNVGIAGTFSGQYDHIEVTGSATLGGNLNVAPEYGFGPVPGNVFSVLTSADRLYGFGAVNGTNFPADYYAVSDPLNTAFPGQPYTVRVVRQKWFPLTPTGTPPPARYSHSAVYAPATDRMIVFGGEVSGVGASSDLWVLDHASGFIATPHWTQLSPTGTAPDPRQGHSAVYDVVNNRMIVFGGQNDNPGFYDDVWVLTNADGSSGTPAWVKFPDLPSPLARAGHSACYDPITNHMVVWGGEWSCFAAPGDMWMLDHANGIGATTGWWTLSTVGTTPPLRRDAAAAYDPNENRLIVYGGKTPCQTGLSDAAVLSNASGAPDVGNPAWSPLGAGASPALPGLNGAPGAYDPLFDRLVVFGGLENDIATFRSSVFLLANTHGPAGWTELPLPAVRPVGRAFHSMVYSEPMHRWIIFGGNAGGTVGNDVWALELEGDAPQATGIGPDPIATEKKQPGLSFSSSPSPNPSARGMQFSVKATGTTQGQIAIYDALGRRVTQLMNGPMTAGEHRFAWEGDVAPGIYFIAVRSGHAEDVRRVVVTR